jgi:hypothetical protein
MRVRVARSGYSDGAGVHAPLTAAVSISKYQEGTSANSSTGEMKTFSVVAEFMVAPARKIK